MKISQLAGALAITAAALPSFAEVVNYTTDSVNVFSEPYSYELNLQSLEKVTFRADVPDEGADPYSPEFNIKLLQAKFHFSDASDLVVNNFQKHNNSDEYIAYVQNAWIFRELQVIVRPQGQGFTEGPLDIRLEIVDKKSRTNDKVTDHGIPLLNLQTHVIDNTPAQLADITSLKYQNKRLTLRLFDRVVYGAGEPYIRVDANWLGHGNRTLKLPANEFPILDIRAIALDTDENQDIVSLNVSFLSSYNSQEEVRTFDLQPLLDAAYGPIGAPGFPAL